MHKFGGAGVLASRTIKSFSQAVARVDARPSTCQFVIMLEERRIIVADNPSAPEMFSGNCHVRTCIIRFNVIN
jgi:hypothetical protein